MKIKLLDASVANKIAAGEVVERPASIVKELVENSIDAGASSVTVEIRGGGSELIRISDNGCGMEEEDVKQAFLRHATSKISRAEDLNDINTLGFRGEALASIAAVSRVRLVTRTADAQEGTEIELEGGKIQKFCAAGCPEGTGIWVKELFFNTPARRKFLKKPSQEASYIGEAMTRLAISNPGISMRFISEGKTLLHTPGDGNLLSAIRAIYGAEVSGNMLPVDYEANHIRLTGYLGNRELQKNNRSWQLLFVNGRWIKNQLVSQAAQDAYAGRLNIGKFPFFILKMELSGNLVDVNVHPNKQEVRFADGLPVYETVNRAVYDALRVHQEVPGLFRDRLPQISGTAGIIEVETVGQETPACIEGAGKTQPAGMPAEPVVLEKGNMAVPAYPASAPEPSAPQPAKEAAPENSFLQPPEQEKQRVAQEVKKFAEFIAQSAPEVAETGFSPVELFQRSPQPAAMQQELALSYQPQYKVTGILFDTYILLEAGEDVYIVDQHAAHERLLFEKFMKQAGENASASQLMLAPAVIQVSPAEQAILEEMLPQLEEIGYEIEAIGPGAFAVKAAPAALGTVDPERFISGLLDESASLRQLKSAELKRSRLIQLSCKSAVKGGDKLSGEDIEKLMELIVQENIPLSCPHGRPILIKLTKRELEVRFKRIQ